MKDTALFLIGVVLAAAALTALVYAADAPAPEVQDVIRARQIVLVNDAGEMRGQLRLNGAGDGILVLYAHDGQQIIQLGPPTYHELGGDIRVPETGGGYLSLSRRHGPGGIMVGIGEDGEAFIKRFGTDGFLIPVDVSP